MQPAVVQPAAVQPAALQPYSLEPCGPVAYSLRSMPEGPTSLTTAPQLQRFDVLQKAASTLNARRPHNTDHARNPKVDVLQGAAPTLNARRPYVANHACKNRMVMCCKFGQPYARCSKAPRRDDTAGNLEG